MTNLSDDDGFDAFTPGQCTTVDLKWVPSARIVRLNAAAERADDHCEITLLRALPESRLRLIPSQNGMVGYPHTPDNPHHLAAFDELLRIGQVGIIDGNVIEVSDLYQFVVGMEMKQGPPSTLYDSLSKRATRR